LRACVWIERDDGAGADDFGPVIDRAALEIGKARSAGDRFEVARNAAYKVVPRLKFAGNTDGG
jgi:hypothetical protein